MEFTSKDLVKAMRLTVGDKIKVSFEFTDEEIFEITESVQGAIYLQAINDFYSQADLGDLIDKKFEIIQRPKKIGELKCDELTCEKCPLRTINCSNVSTSVEKTLYQILENFLPVYHDQEMYDLLKARLDKEVL